MTASAVFVWEPWPLTSFRLFSQVRVEEQSAWEATTLDRAGRELDYPVGGLDHGLRNFGFAMAEFVAADLHEREEMCNAWLDEALEQLNRDAVAVRLYQRTWTLSDRVGDRALPGQRELVYTCTRAGATAERTSGR